MLFDKYRYVLNGLSLCDFVVPTRSRIVGFGEGQTLSHQEKVPLSLECKADFTKPAPRVTWFVADMVRVKGVITNTVLTEDGITYNITSRLTMSPLWRHDTHVVRCVMENMAVGAVSETAVILNITCKYTYSGVS